MNREDLISILAIVIAAIVGIIQAKAKKAAEAAKRAQQKTRPEEPRRTFPEPSSPSTWPSQRPEVPRAIVTPVELTPKPITKPISNAEVMPEEAPSVFKHHFPEDSGDLTLQSSSTSELKHKKPEGFNAKKAVLFSEILKPKFDE